MAHSESTATTDSAERRRTLFCTGGGSGIGRGICLLFASRGYDVAVVDIDESKAGKTARLVEAHSSQGSSSGKKRSADGTVLAASSGTGRAVALRCDVSSATQVAAAVEATVKEFGRIDAAINCAGIEGERARLADYSEDVFDRVTNVNYRGLFLCLGAEIRQLLSQDRIGERGIRGHVVNISSTAGLGAMKEFSAYCGSKWAVLGLTKTAAREYIGDGIRVSAVCPATTATPMVERFSAKWPEWQETTNKSYPIGRVCSVEEVAEAAYFLCSESCGFHVGDALILGGGATC
eukprot:gnl/TRDRNA2_/TRDRNA2_139745_c0_seq1.p1 gnl/TRDRNA2_/TRDRNA2_139745_c0~~gnl/TRDRNA2_/TRDRNA2_139745_c0_seq1.p1  ORF type:complete len:292 (-),score=48.75 gnl/TRDRNA2_/TRDRNA2_139745_c0_seq1:146-1021(-)